MGRLAQRDTLALSLCANAAEKDGCGYNECRRNQGGVCLSYVGRYLLVCTSTSTLGTGTLYIRLTESFLFVPPLRKERIVQWILFHSFERAASEPTSVS
jgi:hypothetical protein